MRVQVDSVEPRPGETVWTAWGRSEDGALVQFAGDWRPMEVLAKALEALDDECSVELEGWQILSVQGGE